MSPAPRIILAEPAPPPEAVLRLALERLHSVCLAMDCEIDGERPSDEEYQRAMAAAEAALAEVPA